jgi:hypothetical protein
MNEVEGLGWLPRHIHQFCGERHCHGDGVRPRVRRVSCDVSDVTFAGYTNTRPRSGSCQNCIRDKKKNHFYLAGARAQHAV